jgi:hypothetical protein
LAFDDFHIGLVISLRVAVLAFDDFCIGLVINLRVAVLAFDGQYSYPQTNN